LSLDTAKGPSSVAFFGIELLAPHMRPHNVGATGCYELTRTDASDLGGARRSAGLRVVLIRDETNRDKLVSDALSARILTCNSARQCSDAWAPGSSVIAVAMKFSDATLSSTH